MEPARPRLAWRCFSAPKAGNSRAEYEDAFAGDAAAARFAIADGASESSFAGAWADLLVTNFIRQPGSWSEWLPAARQAWQTMFQDRELSWFAEEKFLQGAFATFLGLSFLGPDCGLWKAAAIGDSCLFQVRHHRLLCAFPMRHPEAFDNQPALIGSRKTSKAIKRPTCVGDWNEGDKMFLMTDALAHWFLRKATDGQKPWENVLSIASEKDFEGWIAETRKTGDLHNDDVTLMVIDCESAQST